MYWSPKHKLKVALTPSQSCSVESGRWTDAIRMLDSLPGPINIVTLERFAPAGNISLSLHLSGSFPSRRNESNRLCFAVCAVCLDAVTATEIPVRFTVWPRPRCSKSPVMLSLPLAVRREKQCEGSLSVSETSSNSYTLRYAVIGFSLICDGLLWIKHLRRELFLHKQNRALERQIKVLKT